MNNHYIKRLVAHATNSTKISTRWDVAIDFIATCRTHDILDI